MNLKYMVLEYIYVKISFFNPRDFNHKVTKILLQIQNIKLEGQKRLIIPEKNVPINIKAKASKTLDFKFSPSDSDRSQVYYLEIDGNFIRGPIEHKLIIEFLDKSGNRNTRTIDLAKLVL